MKQILCVVFYAATMLGSNAVQGTVNFCELSARGATAPNFST